MTRQPAALRGPHRQAAEPRGDLLGDEVPEDLLHALQDWKAGMMDPWADGVFEEGEAGPAKRPSEGSQSH